MKRSTLDSGEDAGVRSDSADPLSNKVKKAKTTAVAPATAPNAAKVLKDTSDVTDKNMEKEKDKKKAKKKKKKVGLAKNGHGDGGVGGLPMALKRLLGSAKELVVVGKSTRCSGFVPRGAHKGKSVTSSTISNATGSNTSSSADGACGGQGPVPALHVYTCKDCGRVALKHRLEVQARRTKDGGSPLFPLLRAARQVLYATGGAGLAWCYSLVHALRAALAQEPGLDAALRAALGQVPTIRVLCV
jgi:hypothetical protein